MHVAFVENPPSLLDISVSAYTLNLDTRRVVVQDETWTKNRIVFLRAPVHCVQSTLLGGLQKMLINPLFKISVNYNCARYMVDVVLDLNVQFVRF